MYEDIFIDSIYVDTQDTFVNYGPSDEPVYLESISGNRKSMRLILTSEDLHTTLDNLFFVYVTTKGNPNPTLPTNFGDYYTDVIANLHPLYKASIKIMSDLEDHCKDQNTLIDLILKVNTFDITLRTCNYPLAIQYWNKFFKKIVTNKLNNNCRS